jgi:hypothetical protein
VKYWTITGLSRPNWALSWCSWAGDMFAASVLAPARRSDTGSLGSRLRITNVTV